MGDASKFGIAILALFFAMLCFFFAFHPGGVQGVSSPDKMLEWLFQQWDNASGVPGGNTANG